MNRIYSCTILVLVFALAFAVSAFAQGQINYGPETFTTPSGLVLTAPGVSAEAQTSLSAEAAATAVTPTQTFRLYPVKGFVEDKELAKLYVDFSGLAIGEHKEASFAKFDLGNGRQMTMHYWVKRTDVINWWAYAELPAVPDFTVPGGPWARGSQIVWIGDIHSTCGDGPAFARFIQFPDGNEVGWLDLSERGTGPGGSDGLFRRFQHYPVPGSQDVARDGMTIRYFGLYDLRTPAGERIGNIFAVHVIDEARRSNIYLLDFEQSIVCNPCQGRTAISARDVTGRSVSAKQ